MTYGDIDNVTKDAKLLYDIIARQGTDILLEVMADHLGHVANKFSLTQAEVQRVITFNVTEYRELAAERT